jgi:hypothetical protein
LKKRKRISAEGDFLQGLSAGKIKRKKKQRKLKMESFSIIYQE